MKFTFTFLLTFCLSLFRVNCALLGIDFGTEFTKAILVAPGVPFDILLTSESKRKDVSGLALVMNVNEDDSIDIQRKYGTQALSTCIKSPQSCMLYLKPLLGIGKVDENMHEYTNKFPGIGLGIQNGRDAVTVVTYDKELKHNDTLLLEEVIAMEFLEIKNHALDYWRERSPETVGTIDEVVISVPRYFTEAARISLADAAELAGMKVVGLVDDGLSIAIDYSQKRKDFKENSKEYHLIFDAGAGATKLSLVSLNNINETIHLELENYSFNDKLNGELFTIMVRASILEQFSAETGISIDDILYDQRTMQKVWQAAEKAKLILSANSETTVNIESIYGDFDFKGTITRAELESRMEIPLTSIPKMLDSIFKTFDVKKLNSVILSGGVSRVPIIQKILIDYFGSEDILSKNVNADESVVFGTTLSGAQILGLTRKKTFEIIDRTSVNYEINYFSANDSSVKGSIEVPSGILSDQKFSVNLTDFSKQFLKGINVEILQGGEILTQIYNFTTPKRFNETTCAGGIEYNLNYGFSKSDIFKVNNIKISCHSMNNGTISKIAKNGVMHGEPKYFGFQPMPSKMKKTSISRLNALEAKDLEHQQMSDMRNKLESKLYDMRYLLEEFETTLPTDIFENYSTNVSEILDWLDYESEEATLKEIKDKIDAIENAKSEVSLYDLVSEFEKAVTNIKVPFEELMKKKNSTLEKIEDILSRDNELATECEKYGVDFESTVKKVHGASWPNMDLVYNKIEEEIAKGENGLKLLENGVEKFEEIERKALVQAIKDIKKTYKLFDSVINSFETVFANRKEFVQYQLTAAKKSAKKEKKQSTSSLETDVTSESITLSTTLDVTSSTGLTTSSATSTTKLSHDEL